MAARKKIWGFSAYSAKPKKKRPGIHSKCRHTKQKHGKYYTGVKNGCKRYKGQGR